MAKSSDIPEFGALSGVRVACLGNAIAAPFAAALMADAGAEVVFIESTHRPDPSRQQGWTVAQDRRNQRCLALNVPTEEGRKVFLKLMKKTDILIEGSRGGTFDKWKLSDEVLWETNPKLVIAHVSGFGQKGIEEYTRRASWDAIGQAFGGYLHINGLPEPNPPVRANPYTCDYYAALNACWASLAGYIKAQSTGKGDSVDVAQFEVMIRASSYYPMDFAMTGTQSVRLGNEMAEAVGYNAYKCKDGMYIFIAMLGYGVLEKGLPLLGFEFGSEDFPYLPAVLRGVGGDEKLEKALKEFCESRTAKETEEELLAVGVPCSVVYDYKMAMEDPHYQAREVFTEWDDPSHERVKGINIIPKFTNFPGKIWRGGAKYGADNDDILEELGYNVEEVDELYNKDVVSQAFDHML
jgi:L-carnitine CoA-transferase